jgi:hypothetical protein
MRLRFNKFLDTTSEFLAHRKGLLPILGLTLVIANAVLQFLPMTGWWVESNLLLHLGVIVITLGFLLAWAL